MEVKLTLWRPISTTKNGKLTQTKDGRFWTSTTVLQVKHIFFVTQSAAIRGHYQLSVKKATRKWPFLPMFDNDGVEFNRFGFQIIIYMLSLRWQINGKGSERAAVDYFKTKIAGRYFKRCLLYSSSVLFWIAHGQTYLGIVGPALPNSSNEIIPAFGTFT